MLTLWIDPKYRDVVNAAFALFSSKMKQMVGVSIEHEFIAPDEPGGGRLRVHIKVIDGEGKQLGPDDCNMSGILDIVNSFVIGFASAKHPEFINEL